jgi:hypothetical protein
MIALTKGRTNNLRINLQEQTMKSPKNILSVLITGVLLLAAGSARAEMSEGLKETGIACAYMGGIGAAAGAVFEKGALKTGAIACGTAAAAMGSYQYLVIPADAAEAPDEADLNQADPASDQVSAQ